MDKENVCLSWQYLSYVIQMKSNLSALSGGCFGGTAFLLRGLITLQLHCM